MNAAENSFNTQIVDFPTHIKGNLLDVVYTDIPGSVISCEDIGNLSNSDHSIIKLVIDFAPKSTASSELIRDWRRGDKESLAIHISEIDFPSLFQGENVDEAWETLKGSLNQALDRYIPLTERRKKGDPPWMTQSVRRLVRKKQRKWRVFAKNRTDLNFVSFKSAEKESKKAVQNAKRNFEKKIASSKNKRPFNSYVKSKTKSKCNVGPLQVGSEFVSDSKGMAQVLNQFFSSVFTRDDPSQHVPEVARLPSNSALTNIRFSALQVKKKLDNLKSGSAPGPDGLTTDFLKNNSAAMSVALSELYNLSLAEGKVPADWRLANVTPIFKKGSKGQAGNYRPVSLTSIPCRVMESCI